MPIDFAELKLTRRPNQFLALPSGFIAKAQAHAASPVFAAPPEMVIDALKRIALAEPRTALIAEDRAAHRLALVARSKTFHFPDYIDAEAIALAPGQTGLAIYSRAKYGLRDFGVNRARIERWLAALRGQLS
ncbi:MAG TPA: DUF1499 domain-containing protein [Alphaproteobacteria bacterium]|jgi:uncharacterized protein (DUF1499 family)